MRPGKGERMRSYRIVDVFAKLNAGVLLGHAPARVTDSRVRGC